MAAPQTSVQHETATFAGGCFWCVESAFEGHAGIEEVVSGYTGGTTDNPTYEEVCSGKTGHLEAVQLKFDPTVISFDKILDIFWRSINPTDAGGQFADRGSQYASAIFYHTPQQQALAQSSKERLGKSKKFSAPVATVIRASEKFYPAEEYHQDYHKKNPAAYKRYHTGSGRADFIKTTWKEAESPSACATYAKPPINEIQKRLTPEQFDVTQKNGTEPAFRNAYYNNKNDGIYVDIVSGEPLFSSRDKFDSGTGWPSFTRPIQKQQVVEITDNTHGMARTEVRSKCGDSHLGHVFPDGPAPTGQRYCINSAALRFISKDDLAKQGYGEWARLFDLP